MLAVTTRLALLASVASALAFAAPSDAGCYGASGRAVVCAETYEVTRECVYTGGGTCQWVVVSAPVCVSGTIGGAHFWPAWC